MTGKYLNLAFVHLFLLCSAAVVQAVEMVGVDRFQAVGRGKYGEVLRTLKRAKGWVKVRREDGLTGWVSRRLVWGW